MTRYYCPKCKSELITDVPYGDYICSLCVKPIIIKPIPECETPEDYGENIKNEKAMKIREIVRTPPYKVCGQILNINIGGRCLEPMCNYNNNDHWVEERGLNDCSCAEEVTKWYNDEIIKLLS